MREARSFASPASLSPLGRRSLRFAGGGILPQDKKKIIILFFLVFFIYIIYLYIIYILKNTEAGRSKPRFRSLSLRQASLRWRSPHLPYKGSVAPPSFSPPSPSRLKYINIYFIGLGLRQPVFNIY